ncbi:MAG: class II aldolase/adducin family protein [Burkholderiales bacterium]
MGEAHMQKRRIAAGRSRAGRGTAGMDPREREARLELAACYRLVALKGWTDMIGNHISVRVPGSDDRFLINPFGMRFDEVTASSLLVIDVDGNKLSDSPWPVNRAGFVIHSAIHMGRSDAHCVMHLHGTAGVAVSMQKDGLLPASQQALTIMHELRYHDYEGIAFDTAERERLLADLGDGGVMILRNHGTLAVGRTVAEMYTRMCLLERACHFQVAALAGGSALNPLPQEVIRHTIAQGRDMYAKGGQSAGGELFWKSELRWLDHVDRGYAR